MLRHDPEPHLRLRLDLNRPLNRPDAERFDELVRQRARRIPLQHLLGRAPFLDLDLVVTPAVLIPRPETEGLALRASERLKRLPDPTTDGRAPCVLDFATGSGCLALYLASQHSTAEVHALDISAAALAVAQHNANRLRLQNRVTFHLSDGFAALEKLSLPDRPRFELLVTNPPYIPSAEISQLEPEVRDHDPRLALDGGGDGLVFYRRLAREAPPWLEPNGWLLAEFGDGQTTALQELFSEHGWRAVQIEKDLGGHDRILLARPPAKSIVWPPVEDV